MSKLQKTLSADQKNWRNQKGVLVREISGLKAKQADLTSKNTELSNQIEAKKALAAKFDKQLAKSRKAVGETSSLQTRAQADLTSLNEELDRKKANVDKELEDYRKQREIEAEADISPKVAELDRLNSDIELAQSALESIKSEISVQQTSRSEALAANRQEVVDLETKVTQTRTEAEEIGKNIEELQILEEDLKSKLRELQYTRDQAIADTNKAKIEYDQFVKYEQKARDALNAKDKSLQLREDAIEQNSIMMRNARSNLPQM